MHTETILLIDGSERVREAVARSYAQAGAYVEALASCAEAIDFLAAFRPDWILVDEHQADELLHWMRGHRERMDVPVVGIRTWRYIAGYEDPEINDHFTVPSGPEDLLPKVLRPA